MPIALRVPGRGTISYSRHSLQPVIRMARFSSSSSPCRVLNPLNPLVVAIDRWHPLVRAFMVDSRAVDACGRAVGQPVRGGLGTRLRKESGGM